MAKYEKTLKIVSTSKESLGTLLLKIWELCESNPEWSCESAQQLVSQPTGDKPIPRRQHKPLRSNGDTLQQKFINHTYVGQTYLWSEHFKPMTIQAGYTAGSIGTALRKLIKEGYLIRVGVGEYKRIESPYEAQGVLDDTISH